MERERAENARMLTLSVVSKRFICNVQVQIPGSEGGVAVVLQTRDKCHLEASPDSQTNKPTATLNIAVNSGRGNDLSKCRELLSFLAEKALPKTLKLINVKYSKKENIAARGKRTGLFSCVRPERLDLPFSSHAIGVERGYPSDAELGSHAVGRFPSEATSSCEDLRTARIPTTPQIIRRKLEKAGILNKKKSGVVNASVESFNDDSCSSVEFSKNPQRDKKPQEEQRTISVSNSLEEVFPDAVVSKNDNLEMESCNKGSLSNVLRPNDNIEHNLREISSYFSERNTVKTSSERCSDTTTASVTGQCPGGTTSESGDTRSSLNGTQTSENLENKNGERIVAAIEVTSCKTNNSLQADAWPQENECQAKLKPSQEMAKALVEEIIANALRKSNLKRLSNHQTAMKNVECEEAKNIVQSSQSLNDYSKQTTVKEEINIEGKPFPDENVEDCTHYHVTNSNSLPATDLHHVPSRDHVTSASAGQHRRDSPSFTSVVVPGRDCLSLTSKPLNQDNSNQQKMQSVSECISENTVVTCDANMLHQSDDATEKNISFVVGKVKNDNGVGIKNNFENGALDTILIEKTLDIESSPKQDEYFSRTKIRKADILRRSFSATTNHEQEKVVLSSVTRLCDECGGFSHVDLSDKIDVKPTKDIQHLVASSKTYQPLPEHVQQSKGIDEFHIPETAGIHLLPDSIADTSKNTNESDAPTKNLSDLLKSPRPASSVDPPVEGSMKLQSTEASCSFAVNRDEERASHERTPTFLNLSRFHTINRSIERLISSDIPAVPQQALSSTWCEAEKDNPVQQPANVGKETSVSERLTFCKTKHSVNSDSTKTLPTKKKPRKTYHRRTISDVPERKRWTADVPSDNVGTGSNISTSLPHPHLYQSMSRESAAARKLYGGGTNGNPVVTEDDIVLESLYSHHQDICDTLTRRAWVVRNLHASWSAKKPLELVRLSAEMAGMDSSDNSQAARQDYALFLNILQQLPKSCSSWPLDTCLFLLPNLKNIISKQHHSSHVEMACDICHVIIKKVNAVSIKAQKARKPKDKTPKLQRCTTKLEELRDHAAGVLQGLDKSLFNSPTDDVESLQLKLRELLLALDTLFDSRVC